MENNRLVQTNGVTVRAGDQALIYNVDFHIDTNEIVGIAGESGSGKSMLTKVILNILPKDCRQTDGEVVVLGQRMNGLTNQAKDKLITSGLGLVPQNTVVYLHPLIKIQSQMIDGYIHRKLGSKKEAIEKASGLLKEVGIDDPKRVLNSYPAQLSGGMRQRVNIAMALMSDPKLLIADEPTTALDCVVQQQVLDLFVQLNQTRHVAIIMISHNLDLLRAYCSRVYVMYAGRIVESGNADAVFNDPKHPYTKALLSLIPGLEVDKTKPLAELPGMVPEKDRDRTSCIFAPRCPKAADACGQTIQPMDDNDRYILCPFADSKPKEVA